MARWKIYYGDDTSFSDEQGSPKDAPALNVQIIRQADDRVGVFNQAGNDYYIYRDNRWWGVDIFGLFDYLMETGLVKFGRTIGNKEYQEIYQRTKNDPDFPPKDAFLPGERGKP